MPDPSSPWTDSLDTLGRPHSSRHRDGHRIGRFDDGWWAYPAGWTLSNGIQPTGPHKTLDEAKWSLTRQGFQIALDLGGDA